MINKNFKSVMDIFAKTYNRKMFSFMGYGEIGRMKKVKTVRQTTPEVSMGSHVDEFIKQKKTQFLLKVVK
tara:strand:- start:149 stop:358 length:210 start_codon:yes stop_codon:yes gene_type:complete